jgi:hypothetical protein
MRVPLAGGTQETLLSEVGPVLLRFVSTADACALRLVCREFLAAVTEHPWEDRRTAIQGNIRSWRACFPRARCANVQQRGVASRETRVTPLVDADFVHFEGLREVYMAGCNAVTDASFVSLRGINTLDMSYCDQQSITDSAFAHLHGIKWLSIRGCIQPTITDAAFQHLSGILVLDMSFCEQFSDAAFVNLQGICELHMSNCSQPSITDQALVHLRGIRVLDISFCRQVTITGATFSCLLGIAKLVLSDARLTHAAHRQGLQTYNSLGNRI